MLTTGLPSDRIVSRSRDSATTTRLASLDSLRGLAAVSVVTCHYLIVLQKTEFGVHLWRWLWIPPLPLFTTAYGSVILFFVLSGFVLTLSLPDEQGMSWGMFALRRFFRIWPPYAVAILIAFAITHVAGGPVTVGMLLSQIAMTTSRISLDTVGWSLVHELRISLAFPLLLVFVRRAPATTIIASLCLEVANRDGPPWLAALVPDTMAYIVYFAVGAWLALNRTRLAGLQVSALAGSLLCGLALVLLSVPVDYPYCGVAVGVGASLMLASVNASPAISRVLSTSCCEFLGRISYSLYLTHVVVLMTLSRLLGPLLPVWAILVIATPVIGIVAVVGHRWVELPSIKLGRFVAARFAPRKLSRLELAPAIRAE